MFNSSTIEISAAALRANLDFIHGALGGTQLCSVVKGNAYGHGTGAFATLAQELGVDRFAVYSASEAVNLLDHVEVGAKIYIMGDVDGPSLEWAVEQGIAFNVFERERLDQAVRAAHSLRKRARIHLEIETGMHRTGFKLDRLPSVLQNCKRNADALEISGICTHLAGAESRSNAERIATQKTRFRKALAIAERSGTDVGLRHVACSAGVLNEPDILFDMARVGILQYGFWPNKETEEGYRVAQGLERDPLQRVIRWWSRVMSIGTVPPGDHVGYGNAFEAEKERRIATVPVGYAFGYARSLSNSGHVLIRGRKAPVRGIVNMNCITVDITGIEGVEKGDEAVLIGTQGTRSISVASFGDLSDQLNYELLTRLPHDIPRKVVEKHP
jgi:alanine racemase